MEIEILKKTISQTEQYQISIDSRITHTGITQSTNPAAEITLFESAKISDKPRAVITKKVVFFAAKYEIKLPDEKVLKFTTKSIFKLWFQCQFGNDIYDIYGHRGNKYSIYKNNIQIAWWDKNVVAEFTGDNYRITTDSKVDYNLIISFCLVLDSYFRKKADETPNMIDLGNIGFQEKKFDKNWTPRL